jgi:hypothetical protein
VSGPRLLTHTDRPAEGDGVRWVFLVAVLAGLVAVASADDKDDLDKAAKSLASKDKATRLKAAQQLASAGEPASKLLCDALLDKDAGVAKAALASLEKANPKLYEPLNRLLNYPDGVNQTRAIKALTELGEDVRPAYRLLEVRMRETAVLGKGGLSAEDRADFVPKYFAMLKRAGDAKQLVELHKSLAAKPINYLRSQDVWSWLVEWAGDKEDRRKELIPLIKPGVVGPMPSVHLIRLAGEYGPLSKEMLPALKKLDFVQDEAVRQAALEAVKKIEKP